MRAPVVLTCVALLAGCGGSSRLLPSRPSAEAETRIAALEAEILTLRRQSAVDTVEIGRLRQRIAALDSTLEETRRHATERADAERADTIRVIEAERVAATRPSIEEDDLEEEPAPSTPQPSTQPSPQALSTAAATPPVPPVATESAPAAATNAVTAAGQEIYDRGYTLFHQQRYQDAEDQFRRFLEGEPATDLSDNAQYWIGECRFALGDHAGALTAFTSTVERFPRGNKVPDAMVKAGKSLEKLGDLDGAVHTYREVLEQFSGTAAAAQARERLDTIPR